MTDDLIPIAPSLAIAADLRAALRAGFVLSSADWSRRATEATARGDLSAASTFAAVARIADGVVARGPS